MANFKISLKEAFLPLWPLLDHERVFTTLLCFLLKNCRLGLGRSLQNEENCSNEFYPVRTCLFGVNETIYSIKLMRKVEIYYMISVSLRYREQ